MPLRGLLAALIALVLAAGLVWWSKQKGDADPEPSGPKLFSFDETAVRRVELVRARGETTVLERTQDNLWRITAPAAYDADRDAAQTLLNAFTALSAEQVVEESATEYAPFGLEAPALRAAVTLQDGATHTLLLGDEVPAGAGYYARLEGDARVLTISSAAQANLDQTAANLRDKRLLTFDPATLTRLVLRARGESVEFGRDARNNWQIVAPAPLRADGWLVEELIRRLREARLDPELDEDEARQLAAEFGRAAPLSTITAITPAGEQTLTVRRAAGNRYLAQSTVVPGVHLLTNDTGEGFDKSTADFRTRKLFDFGFAEPARVEVRHPEFARSFVKEGAAWQQDGRAVDSVGVQSLIDRLRDLGADGFPSSGFTKAEVEISVTSGDPAVTEKLLVSRVNGRFIARRDGEPALYDLKEEAVNELIQAARDVKDAPAPAKK